MYKLIRRISSSFFPRPDRPWPEDATSSAPQIGRKRRLSSTEPDEPSPSVKKQRADSPEGSDDAESSRSRPGRESEGVKEVTKGVKEVELEEGRGEATASADATAVPLPDSPLLSATDDAKEALADATDGPAEQPSPVQPIVIAEVAEPGEQANETEEGEAGEGEQAKTEENAVADEIPGLSSSAENKSLETMQTGVHGVKEPTDDKATDDETKTASTPTPTSSAP